MELRSILDKPRKEKKGGLSDLFIFLIFAFIIVLISVIFVYMGGKANDKLQETLGNKSDLHNTEGENASVVIEGTMGKVESTYHALEWITVLLIIGMVLSIFIGSYLVTTRPVFFLPYIFIVIIAIVVSVPMSNTYEDIMGTEVLSDTFSLFGGANWIMLNLPIWVSIIGIAGGIIMYVRMGKGEEVMYYG